ncbi:MAG: hypothetical protein AAF517_04360, partial [Planctomycetota bacterium]
MRKRLKVTALLLSVLVSSGFASAQNPGADPAGDDDIQKALQDIRMELDALRNAGQGATADEQLGRGGIDGIYDKPYLRSSTPKVSIGGYFDVEYRNPSGSRHDFRFHRFVPSFYSDLHDRLRFASEVEIEDASIIEIEFSFLDFLITRYANLRGGVILSPLGKFNLIHDSPINELTDRPLVNTIGVLPTTQREIGIGLFGTLTPVDSLWDVKYEAYVTTGFKVLAADGETTVDNFRGLRDAKPSKTSLNTRAFDDNNDSFSGVGRISASPFLGSELGVSAHSGNYDENDRNNLTIVAIDGYFTVPEFKLGDFPVGPVEFQGEAGYGAIERDALAGAADLPSKLWGYYVQM